MPSDIIYQATESIAHITLNRPETGNVISESLAEELRNICQKINEDETIRVAVLTATGSKTFCLGSDLEQRLTDKNAKLPSIVELKNLAARCGVASTIANLNCPVVAAVNGDALGQGLELALSCDIRIASDAAHFGFPNITSGLMPMDGGTQRLPRIVGKGKSLEMILTGDIIDAKEAYQIGLVNKVVPKEKLAAEAESWARKIATKAPIALKYTKEAVNKGLDLTLAQGLRLEADLYFLLHTTEDRTEGIRAFLAKRTPDFKGK